MDSQYTVHITAAEDRIAYIARQVKDAQARRDHRKEYKFRGGVDIPLVTLPLAYLIYRLENYRTRDTQLSLVATGVEELGFFNPQNQESPSAQRKQHQILFEQAQKGSGESVQPIYDELRRVAQQTEDLIVTSSGVVVNGNRRLSAMRELWESDPQKFKSFEYVQCSVLPESATAKEILMLEIGLQMQPETKLPYGWTALGMAVRDLRESQVGDDEIARLMNRDRTDIVRAAKMLDNADIYLSEWLDKPQSYDQLEETEQAFKQIAIKNNVKGDDSGIREITRQFDFLLIEQRQHLNDRAYVFINAIEQNAQLFLDNLATTLDIDLPPAEPTKLSQMKISFEPAEPSQKSYEPLVEYLHSQRDDSNAIKSLVATVQNVSLIVAEQNKKKENAALDFATQAEKRLLAIDMQTAGPETYDDLQQCLERCIQVSESLLGELFQRQVQGRTK
ncbi:hypothetical protein OH708_21260 [Pseudomonas capsici]|uniref:hypothetical protein n=1 Tax=Pseudomonas capsici TaxID=2810614 RepID=UPI0021F1EE1B|nr:hypothetical protein [Pseudomonas capsici]MCV4290445.1 hypothetical protein [Pseudomonas capsici]